MATVLRCSGAMLKDHPEQESKTNRRFNCLTCKKFCCKVCAEKCHRSIGHEVVFYGRTDFCCDCYTSDSCQCNEVESPQQTPFKLIGVDQNKDWCSYMVSSTYCIYQMLYDCETCDLRNESGICITCKETCHKGHSVSNKGKLFQGICGCGSGKQLDKLHPQHANMQKARKFTSCKNITPKTRISHPPKMGQHSAVVYKDALYIFGGAFDFVTNDMFQLDFRTKVWYRVTQQGKLPGIRSAHSAVTYKNGMFIFGGVCGSERFQGLYRFDFDTNIWEKVETTGVTPPGRYFSTCCIHDDKLYVFGGMLDENRGCENLFELDLKTMNWTLVETVGAAVPKTNGMTSCVYGDRMYVFGGFNHEISKFSSTLFEYNFLNRSWSIIAHEGVPVPRRAYHTAVVYGDKMCIYGGKTPFPSSEKNKKNNTNISSQDLAYRQSQKRERIYAFDIPTKKWSEFPSNFDVPNVFFHHSVIHGTSMYSIGGNDRENNCYNFYEFDFMTKRWLRYDDDWHFVTTYTIDKLLPEAFCYNVIFELKNSTFMKAHLPILAQAPELLELINQDHWITVDQAEKDEYDAFDHTNDNIDSNAKQESDEIFPYNRVFIIRLPEVDPSLFQQFLYLLYGSEQLVINDCLQLLDLLELVHRFKVYNLKDTCYHAIEFFMSVDEVLDVLQASKIDDYPKVKKQVLSFIAANYEEVVQLPQLNELPKSVILEILRHGRVQPEFHQKEPLPVSPSLELMNHLRNLRQNGDYHDVILVSARDGEKFKAHRCVLASQSEFFRRWFEGHYSDSHENVVQLDTDAQVVSIILDFFYCGTLKFSDLSSSRSKNRAKEPDEHSRSVYQYFRLLLDVGYMADYISHPTLQHAAHNRLLSEINLENANPVLYVLSHYPNHTFSDDIRTRCAHYLSSLSVESLLQNYMDLVSQIRPNVPLSQVNH